MNIKSKNWKKLFFNLNVFLFFIKQLQSFQENEQIVTKKEK